MPDAHFDGKAFVLTLPAQPGVYRMLNAAGDVIYVGKAIDLRKRVSSYFQKSGLSPRIQLMVSQIAGSKQPSPVPKQKHCCSKTI